MLFTYICRQKKITYVVTVKSLLHYNFSVICPWAQHDQLIYWIEPNSTSRHHKGQKEVLGPEDVAVNSNPQPPPGSFPRATRVAAHGKQAAPFSRLLWHARGVLRTIYKCLQNCWEISGWVCWSFATIFQLNMWRHRFAGGLKKLYLSS